MTFGYMSSGRKKVVVDELGISDRKPLRSVEKMKEDVTKNGQPGYKAKYAYIESNGTDAYVKYSILHAETKRRYANNSVLLRNIH